MCYMAVIPIVIAAASAAYQVKSSMDQAKAQNQANQYNADIQNRNATVANMQANEQIAEGDIAAKEHLQNVKALIGTQRAEQGASGGIVDVGSNERQTEDTAQFGKLDALTIKSNAARNAWALGNQSANFKSSADLLSSSNLNVSGIGTGSALTGVSSLTSKIYDTNQSGGFSSTGRPASIKAEPVYL